VSGPFPSWNRSILTAIYLCHACAYHEIEDGNGPDRRGYKRAKQEELGSRAKRMQKKLALSKEAYQALKPYKPRSMMALTLDQRRGIYASVLGGADAAMGGAGGVAEVQWAIHMEFGTLSVAVAECAEADRSDSYHELERLKLEISGVASQLQRRAESLRLNAEVASIELLSERAQLASVSAQQVGDADAKAEVNLSPMRRDTGIANGDGREWLKGQLLYIPGTSTTCALKLTVDTAAITEKDGAVCADLAPIQLMYSAQAHACISHLMDTLPRAPSADFVSSATGRVPRLTQRATQQLKARLHRTQARQFTLSLAGAHFLLPMDVDEPYAAAMEASFGAVTLKSTPYNSGAAAEGGLPTRTSGEGSSGEGRCSPALEVDADVAKNLYQCVRLDATDARLVIVNSDDSVPRQHLIEPFSFHLTVEAMLVDEVQIDGTSLTANLPWYQLRATVPMASARLDAAQLPLLLTILRTLDRSPLGVTEAHATAAAATAAITAPGRSPAGAVWPLYARAELCCGQFDLNIEFDVTQPDLVSTSRKHALVLQLSGLHAVRTSDFGNQSWLRGSLDAMQLHLAEVTRLFTTQPLATIEAERSAVEFEFEHTFKGNTVIAAQALRLQIDAALQLHIPFVNDIDACYQALAASVVAAVLPGTPSPRQYVESQSPHTVLVLDLVLPQLDVLVCDASVQPLLNMHGRALQLKLTRCTERVDVDCAGKHMYLRSTCVERALSSVDEGGAILVGIGNSAEDAATTDALETFTFRAKFNYHTELNQWQCSRIHSAINGVYLALSDVFSRRAYALASAWQACAKRHIQSISADAGSPQTSTESLPYKYPLHCELRAVRLVVPATTSAGGPDADAARLVCEFAGLRSERAISGYGTPRAASLRSRSSGFSLGKGVG
jgi:hypothetical protein